MLVTLALVAAVWVALGALARLIWRRCRPRPHARQAVGATLDLGDPDDESDPA